MSVHSQTVTPAPPATRERQENLLLSLACNVAVPALILSKLSRDDRLGPVWSLLVALAFPLTYGTWDLIRRRKWNPFSILGLVSVLLTGGLGLMKANALWFAVKEAAIPLIFGIAVILSLRTRTPLVRTLLYNERVINTAKVETALLERNTAGAFERLLVQATWLLAASFFLSAILNFWLARYLLQSPPGSPEFNAELGRMTALSWPVIVVPSMLVMFVALWHLLRGIKRLTGYTLEEVFQEAGKKEERLDI